MITRRKLVSLETVLRFNEIFPEEFNIDIDDFFKDMRNFLFDSEYVAYMLGLFFPAISDERLSDLINNGWSTGISKNLLGGHFKKCAIGKRTKILENKCKEVGELYKFVNYDEIVKGLDLNLSEDENKDFHLYFLNLKGRTKGEGMLNMHDIDTYKVRFNNISHYIDCMHRYFINNGIRPHKGLRVNMTSKKKDPQMFLFN